MLETIERLTAHLNQVEDFLQLWWNVVSSDQLLSDQVGVVGYLITHKQQKGSTYSQPGTYIGAFPEELVYHVNLGLRLYF